MHLASTGKILHTIIIELLKTLINAQCQLLINSAVKEPDRFEVRKSSTQVTRMHFFSSKKLTTLFLVVALKTQATNARFTVKIKQIKLAIRYGNIFIFCSHYYRSKVIRRARQSEARAVDLPARSFDLARPDVVPPLLITITLYDIMFDDTYHHNDTMAICHLETVTRMVQL